LQLDLLDTDISQLLDMEVTLLTYITIKKLTGFLPHTVNIPIFNSQSVYNLTINILP